MSFGLVRAVNLYDDKHRDFRDKTPPLTFAKCVGCGNDLPLGGLCNNRKCEFYSRNTDKEEVWKR